MKGEKKQVTTTPTIIAGGNSAGTGAGPGSTSYPTAALIRVPTGAQTVYFGGSAVTAATGCPLIAGEDLVIDLVNEMLYAVTSTTSQTVYVLRRGD